MFVPAGHPSGPVAPPPLDPELELPELDEPDELDVVVFGVVVVVADFAFVHGFAFVLFWPVLHTGIVQGCALVLFWPVLHSGTFALVVRAALAPSAPTTNTATSSSAGTSLRMSRIPTLDLLCIDNVWKIVRDSDPLTGPHRDLNTREYARERRTDWSHSRSSRHRGPFSMLRSAGRVNLPV